MGLRRVDARAGSDAWLSEAVAVLRRGGIVAYPTETFYGLGVRPFDLEAVARLVALKGRPPDKPFPLVLADETQLALVARGIDERARRLAARFWPGPLTLVLDPAPGLAGTWPGVAVRVTSGAVARRLAAAAGPLVATSANPSGGPPARTAEAILAAFDTGIDLVVDGGPTPGGAPSTIVDVRGGTLRLVRAGAVDPERVRRAWRTP